LRADCGRGYNFVRGSTNWVTGDFFYVGVEILGVAVIDLFLGGIARVVGVVVFKGYSKAFEVSFSVSIKSFVDTGFWVYDQESQEN